MFYQTIKICENIEAKIVFYPLFGNYKVFNFALYTAAESDLLP